MGFSRHLNDIKKHITKIMKHLKLPVEAIVTVPITDLRHTLNEIDIHRHVHTMLSEQNKEKPLCWRVLQKAQKQGRE